MSIKFNIVVIRFSSIKLSNITCEGRPDPRLPCRPPRRSPLGWQLPDAKDSTGRIWVLPQQPVVRVPFRSSNPWYYVHIPRFLLISPFAAIVQVYLYKWKPIYGSVVFRLLHHVFTMVTLGSQNGPCVYKLIPYLPSNFVYALPQFYFVVVSLVLDLKNKIAFSCEILHRFVCLADSCPCHIMQVHEFLCYRWLP